MGMTLRIDERGERRGTGWLPDHPDFRDRTAGSDRIKGLLAKTSVPGLDPSSLPASVDLREWCSPIENQEKLNSCTAHAGVGMVEYFERRAFGKHIDASRLFLYKVTRKLTGIEGDSGATLRGTMGGLRLFGAPPESYWPYSESEVEAEPPAFCYAFGQSFQAIDYYSLDPTGSSPNEVLASVKSHLASNLPSMFGFTVYESIWGAQGDGRIPFPYPGDKWEGGHAVMAVGYDDELEIDNGHGTTTRGAFLIRNSWGTSWGEDGYCWLPYEYVLQGQAIDWWVLLTQEWVDTGEFEFTS